MVRRCSRGLTHLPHGLSPPQAPQGHDQVSALTLPCVRLPSPGAQSHSSHRDSGGLRAPRQAPGPLSPLTTPLPVTYPVPTLCEAHLTFFKMSLASFPESEHLLLLQNGIQTETLFTSPPRGYWDHSLPGAGANARLLSGGERRPSLPVKPQQLANQSGPVSFYLSRDLLFQ